MAFHAILITRDEDDIISQSLDGFLTWADEIHVFDTGSVDTTWDIVNDKAAKDARIRPVERRELWFSDHIRGYCFEKVRDRLRHGDWFLRVDSDEFYHITPPQFVREHLLPSETCVYQQYYDFRMTQEEAEELSSDEAIAAERLEPIEKRRHYYTLGDYAEPRLARYRRHMSWTSNYTWPVNAGLLASKRLPIRHYPNRDPKQLRKRMDLRRTTITAGVNTGRFSSRHHWRLEDWRTHLVNPSDPHVFHWAPGSPLPEYWDTNHLPNAGKRLVQNVAHRFVVPLLDPLRHDRKDLYVPEEMEAEVQAQLKAALVGAVG
jgi:glycosyltransferase involved in cell wall biosynthesis